MNIDKENSFVYKVFNNIKKEYQFPSICEKSRKIAEKKLFKLIGNDAYKWRFEIRKVKK